MTGKIRDFTYEQEDFEIGVAVHNKIYPEYKNSVENWTHWHNTRPAKLKHGRAMLELDGQVIGISHYGQSSFTYHPHKFHFGVDVLPEHRGKGYGKQLYQDILRRLAPHDPIAIKTDTRADMARSVRFITDRDFKEVMRSWESRLDPKAVDLAQWAHYDGQMHDQGIVIKTVADLAADPDRDRKMYELITELDRDVPSPDPVTVTEYDDWHKRFFGSPNLDPNSQFFALDGDHYIGYSALWKDRSSDHLWTGLTGVTRDYRKRGIASAMKIRAVKFALEKGTPCIRTWNEVNNRGMLGINERLGFAKQPAWIDYELKIREEREAEK